MPKFNGCQIDPTYVRIANNSFAKSKENGADPSAINFLSSRAQKAVAAIGIKNQEQAQKYSMAQILNIPNCGRGTAAEIFLWGLGFTEA